MTWAFSVAELHPNKHAFTAKAVWADFRDDIEIRKKKIKKQNKPPTSCAFRPSFRQVAYAERSLGVDLQKDSRQLFDVVQSGSPPSVLAFFFMYNFYSLWHLMIF